MGSLEKLIKELNKTKLKVGWNKNAQYADGTFVATVAEENELGNPSRNIPSRPFIRNAINSNNKKWKKIGGMLAKKLLNKKISVNDVFETLGLVVEGDIKKSLIDLTTPALSPVTIAIRKRKMAKGTKFQMSIEKPLVETGTMLDTITSEVES